MTTPADPDRTATPQTDATRRVEGTRKVVERNLHGRPEGAGGPADPSSDPAWEKHVEEYFDRSPMSDEAVSKATHEMKPEREP